MPACAGLNGQAAAPKERIVDSKPWMPAGLDALMRYDIRGMVNSNLFGLPRVLTCSTLGEVGGYVSRPTFLATKVLVTLQSHLFSLFEDA